MKLKKNNLSLLKFFWSVYIKFQVIDVHIIMYYALLLKAKYIHALDLFLGKNENKTKDLFSNIGLGGKIVF